MEGTLTAAGLTAEQDRQIWAAVEREESRLRRFLRRQLPNAEDVEDVLQDVFCELVEAYRLMKPVEQVGAWLFRVARNRVIDLFRRRKAEPLPDSEIRTTEEGEALSLADLLQARDGGPDLAYARAVLIAELDAALDELPEEQREVFVAHEIEGRSFREMAQQTGLKVNTLLARKHYAVLHLRRRLEALYEEFTDIWTRKA